MKYQISKVPEKLYQLGIYYHATGTALRDGVKVYEYYKLDVKPTEEQLAALREWCKDIDLQHVRNMDISKPALFFPKAGFYRQKRITIEKLNKVDACAKARRAFRIHFPHGAAPKQLVAKIDTEYPEEYGDWCGFLLTHNLIGECDFKRILPTSWPYILRNRPELVEYCPFDTLGSAARAIMLLRCPQYIARVDTSDFDYGLRLRIAAKHPQLAEQLKVTL